MALDDQVTSFPNKGKKVKVPSTKKDKIVVNPKVVDTNINEEKDSTAVMAFGRFNPPTVGHEKLIHKVAQIAKEHGGTAHVIASHSENKPKDPLPQDKKIQYLKKVAPSSVHVSGSSKEAPSFLHAAKKLHEAGHKHLVMVAGSDRVNEYKERLNHYNGKEGHYNFKSIKVVSSGERDPDAEGVEGMSGTKMRAHARAGEMDKFKSGLPKALHSHANEIANHIRSVKEELDLNESFKARFSSNITFEHFNKIYDLVEDYKPSNQGVNSLFKKSSEYNIPLKTIVEVYQRGVEDWVKSMPEDKTAQQWAFARVNSFINGGKALEEDADLFESLKDASDNPCWKGYKPVGTKKKNGKEVPNCVPEERNMDLNREFSRAFQLQEGQADSKPRPGAYEVAIHHGQTDEKLRHYKIKHAESVFHAQNIAGKIAKKDPELKWYKVKVVSKPDLKEDVEQIDEISTSTRMRYVAKAATSTHEPKDNESQSQYLERLHKRMSGIKKALSKVSPASRFQKEAVQIPDNTVRQLKKVTKQLDKSVKTHHKQSELLKKLVNADTPDIKENRNCGCGQTPCKTYGAVK
jgi:phosphopantetheine adenylyltransferase